MFGPQCLGAEGFQDDIHASFKQLLDDLHKKNAPYALSVANRLYGEKSYQFVEVCASAWNGGVYLNSQQEYREPAETTSILMCLAGLNKSIAFKEERICLLA